MTMATRSIAASWISEIPAEAPHGNPHWLNLEISRGIVLGETM